MKFAGTNVENIYKDVVKCFANGLTPHQIAEKFEIEYNDVIFCLLNFGKFRTSIFTRISENMIEEILNLCDSGKKVYEIAKKFNIDRHCVGKILKRYGRQSIHSNKKFALLRKIPFTNLHKNIIIGTLLGDGCIHKQRKNTNNLYKYYLSHSTKQKEYFLWKFKKLQPFMSKYYEVETKLKTVNKTYKGLKATSIGHPEFKKYYDMFYDENGTKYVPKDIEKYLNDFVMALWFMDDGSINSRKNEKGRGLRICSLNFSYEDHIILQNAIKKSFNINTKIGAYKRNNKLYYYISFNKRNSHRLKDIIGKYVLPSMKYKLDLAD